MGKVVVGADALGDECVLVAACDMVWLVGGEQGGLARFLKEQHGSVLASQARVWAKQACGVGDTLVAVFEEL